MQSFITVMRCGRCGSFRGQTRRSLTLRSIRLAVQEARTERSDWPSADGTSVAPESCQGAPPSRSRCERTARRHVTAADQSAAAVRYPAATRLDCQQTRSPGHGSIQYYILPIQMGSQIHGAYKNTSFLRFTFIETVGENAHGTDVVDSDLEKMTLSDDIENGTVTSARLADSAP